MIAKFSLTNTNPTDDVKKVVVLNYNYSLSRTDSAFESTSESTVIDPVSLANYLDLDKESNVYDINPGKLSGEDYSIEILSEKHYPYNDRQDKGVLLTKWSKKIGENLHELSKNYTKILVRLKINPELNEVSYRSLLTYILYAFLSYENPYGKDIKLSKQQKWKLNCGENNDTIQNDGELLRFSMNMANLVGFRGKPEPVGFSKLGEADNSDPGLYDYKHDKLLNNPLDIAKHLKKQLETCVTDGDRYECQILEDSELLNYPIISRVGAGSTKDKKPCIFLLIVKANNEHGTVDSSVKDICVVGKGITYDLGGKDLKPSRYLDGMHRDKTGAMISFSIAMSCLLKGKNKNNLIFMLPLVENSIGNKSYDKGELIGLNKNLTIKVDNTDAEGRLVMADCIYDCLTRTFKTSPKYNVTQFITIATLTGAAEFMTPRAPIMNNESSNEFKDRFLKTSQDTGERFQHLEYDVEHKNAILYPESNNGVILSNEGRSPAGVQTAFSFLEQIIYNYTEHKRKKIKRDMGILHIDIAGEGRDNISKGTPYMTIVELLNTTRV